MATPSSSDSLINQASCFKCIPDGAQPQVQTYLLDQLRNSLTAGWDDLVFPASTALIGGGAAPAQTVATSGPSGDQMALRVTQPGNANFWATVQMPHTWVPGTRVYPHIHVQDQNNVLNSLVWTLAYSIADIDGTFPADTVLTNLPATIPAGSQYKHLVFDLPDPGIDMSAFKLPSTILRLHYTLTGGNTIDLISFDCHIFKSISPVAFTP